MHRPGIGVDDMFAFVLAWENQGEEGRGRTIPDRLGRMVRTTGAAIAITTLTNVLAFASGTLSHATAVRLGPSGSLPRGPGTSRCSPWLASPSPTSTWWTPCWSLVSRLSGHLLPGLAGDRREAAGGWARPLLLLAHPGRPGLLWRPSSAQVTALRRLHGHQARLAHPLLLVRQAGHRPLLHVGAARRAPGGPRHPRRRYLRRLSAPGQPR